MKKAKLTQMEKDEMKTMIFTINNFLMDLLGIHSDREGFITEDGTGARISVRGKFLKLRNVGKDDIPFRPMHNAKLMMLLNGIMSSQLEAEGRHIEFIEYGAGDRKKDKITLSIKERGYDPVVSQPYFNDALRYLDVMCQITERTCPVDLLRLDELMSK